jgi:hypothetical protein
MIGSIQRNWWHIADGGPIVRRLIHEADAAGIDVHLIARRKQPPAQAGAAANAGKYRGAAGA